VGRLLGLEFQRANAFGAIGARYATGAFGWGMGDPFNMSAQADAAGNVRIGCPTGFRMFYQQADGSFKGTVGDCGILTAVAGGYQLKEANGLVTAFGPQGKIICLKLPSGYQVTLNYANGRLGSLSDSYGDSATYAYNAQGRISSFTDRVGRVVSFTYESVASTWFRSPPPRALTRWRMSRVREPLASTPFPPSPTRMAGSCISDTMTAAGW